MGFTVEREVRGPGGGSVEDMAAVVLLLVFWVFGAGEKEGVGSSDTSWVFVGLVFGRKS
jgi:hypothetical protein